MMKTTETPMCRKMTWDECAIDAERPNDVPEVFWWMGQLHRADTEWAIEKITRERREFAILDRGAGI